MEYVGSELEIFSNALNWKNYFSKIILPNISGDVLEVGSGIGSNTNILFQQNISSWTCLEPDNNLLDESKQKISKDKSCNFINGTVATLPLLKQFDVILYIDVLEHIENDLEEIKSAFKILKNNGKLIILSPAHNFLYSPFDKNIGHFRRYNKVSLVKAIDSRLICEKLIYLDSVGFFLSLANRTISKQQSPTSAQILFWDRLIIPFSRIIDYILFYKFGKTILGVWTKKT